MNKDRDPLLRGLNTEVSLMRLFEISYRRRKGFIYFFCITLILSLFYMYSKKSIFESRAVILIGKVPAFSVVNDILAKNQLLIEEPMVLKQRLKERYQNQSYPLLYSVNVDSNVMVLISRGSSAFEARRSLRKIVESLIQEHNSIYENYQTVLIEYLDIYKKQSLVTEKKINKLDVILNNKLTNINSINSIIFFEKDYLESELLTLKQKQKEIESMLLKPVSYRTSVLLEPTLPSTAIESKKFYFVIALLMSLVVSLLFVFFVEFVYGFKSLKKS